MRWVRYRDGERTFYGLFEGDSIREGVGDPFRGWSDTGHRVDVAAVRLLAPSEPTKIVAVGLNYRDHAAEMKKTLPEEPLLFLKPSTAVIGPGDAILCPPQSKQVEYEGELAVVLRSRCRRVTPDEAVAHVLGYTCMIDVTARDIQRRENQYTRAKGFDTFAPLGPWIETDVDPADLAIETFLNGERRQSSRTRELVFSPAALVSFVSHVMTLLPGDVISTGTPAGVGALRPGDAIEVRIAGIGALACHVGSGA
jgi:2-keto-4-pentenoate hydratase/2-oxohepta-3-ene-1,7-dioic acid hydratase in catechol pathway